MCVPPENTSPSPPEADVPDQPHKKPNGKDNGDPAPGGNPPPAGAKSPEPPKAAEPKTPDAKTPDSKTPDSKTPDSKTPGVKDPNGKEPTANPIPPKDSDPVSPPNTSLAGKLPNANNPVVDENNEVWDIKPDGTKQHLGTIQNGTFTPKPGVGEASSYPLDKKNQPASPETTAALKEQGLIQGKDGKWYDSKTKQPMKNPNGSDMSTQQVLDAKGILTDPRRQQLEAIGIKQGDDGNFYKNGKLITAGPNGKPATLSEVVAQSALTNMPPPVSKAAMDAFGGTPLPANTPGIPQGIQDPFKDDKGFVYGFDSEGNMYGLGQIVDDGQGGKIFHRLENPVSFGKPTP